MNLLLKLAAFALPVCFSGFVWAGCGLSPQWGDAPVRSDTRTYAYISSERIVLQEHPDPIAGSELLLRPGNGQADLQNARICVLRSRDGRRPKLMLRTA